MRALLAVLVLAACTTEEEAPPPDALPPPPPVLARVVLPPPPSLPVLPPEPIDFAGMTDEELDALPHIHDSTVEIIYMVDDGEDEEVDHDSHDAILDVEDRCPDEPEDGTGYEDIDGCPEPPPSAAPM